VNGANGHRRRSRRKRVFDYNRYFTDLMSAVSNSSLIETQASEASSESDRAAVAPQASEPAAPLPSNLHGMNSEMIANQRRLIEEQKRLIQEQTRLIEEKSTLIAEKNQLLKMQSEWIDSKLL
jgi:hypothetical protein